MAEAAAPDTRRTARTAAFVLVVAVPLVVGLLAAWLLYRALPATSSVLQGIVYWVVLSLVAILAARGFERVATRVMPLGMLMRLSMMLDDRRLDRALRASDEDAPGVPPELQAEAEAMLADLGARDGAGAMAARRTGVVVDLLAEEIGLGPQDRLRLVWAARLRPVVASAGHRSTAAVLGPLAPWLGEFVVAIDDVTECWDGSGTPHGLVGTEINLGARLLAVAVAYDLLVHGPHPVGDEEARSRLADLAGSQLDPILVRTFLALPAKRVRALVGPLATTSAVPGSAFRLDLLTAASTVGAPVAAVGAGVVLAAILGQVTPGPSAMPAPTEQIPLAVPALPAQPAPTPPTTFDEPDEEESPTAGPLVSAPVAAEVLGIEIVRPVEASATSPDAATPTPATPTPTPAPVDTAPPTPVAPSTETPAPPEPSASPVPTPAPPSAPVLPGASPPQPPPGPVPSPVPSPDPSPEPPAPPTADGLLVVDLVTTVASDGTITFTIVITNNSDDEITGIRAVVTPASGSFDVQTDVGTLAAGASVTIAPTLDAAAAGDGADSNAPARVVVTVTADGLVPVHVIAVVAPGEGDEVVPPQDPPSEPPDDPSAPPGHPADDRGKRPDQAQDPDASSQGAAATHRGGQQA